MTLVTATRSRFSHTIATKLFARPARTLSALLLVGGLATPTLAHTYAASASAATDPTHRPIVGLHSAAEARRNVAFLNAHVKSKSIELAQTTALSSTVASTVPANGDVNPYGVAVVPHSSGKLVQGAVLVSNFNNKGNMAGTGATIVEIMPDGTQHLFAQIDAAHVVNTCPGGVGLTTALSVLKRGYVIVGSLPTKDGTPATLGAGCLIMLDSSGNVVRTISGHGINGPWDMTAYDQGGTVTLFVTNVLNGAAVAGPLHGTNQGTVVRLVLSVPHLGQGKTHIVSSTIIGSGFAERTDPAALILGPTGVGLGSDGTLYVADTLSNRIAAIPAALVRTNTAHSGLDVTAGGAINAPLGLAVAPNGDILTVNGNDGKIVETTPNGIQVFVKDLDTTPVQGATAGAGTLFGLAIAPNGGFYYADDGTSMLYKQSAASQGTLGVATVSPLAGSHVNGVAVLAVNPTTGKIDVTVDVAGLKPNSLHPAHIHSGASCSSNGPVAYPLLPLKADAAGVAHEMVSVAAQSIPKTGWYLNIHEGPGMTGAQAAAIGCGVVTRGL
jgi:hypothetical protein